MYRYIVHKVYSTVYVLYNISQLKYLFVLYVFVLFCNEIMNFDWDTFLSIDGSDGLKNNDKNLTKNKTCSLKAKAFPELCVFNIEEG